MAVVLFAIVFRYGIKMTRAVNGLERAYASMGVEWSFWSDWSFRNRLFESPDSIFDDNDSDEVVGAKNVLLNVRRGMWKVFSWGVVVIISSISLIIYFSLLGI